MNAATPPALFLLLLSGCSHPHGPAMSPRSELPAGVEGKARVVFARPSSRCDTFDHAVIVDESGSFVGTLTPDTTFAILTTPGPHAYFVWPGMDLRSEREPEFHPVGVWSGRLGQDETRNVTVSVVLPREGRGHCSRYAVFEFERSIDGRPVPAREGLRVMEPDLAEGQKVLQEHKELTGAYYLMAREILERRRAAREADRVADQQLRDANLK